MERPRSLQGLRSIISPKCSYLRVQNSNDGENDDTSDDGSGGDDRDDSSDDDDERSTVDNMYGYADHEHNLEAA